MTESAWPLWPWGRCCAWPRPGAPSTGLDAQNLMSPPRANLEQQGIYELLQEGDSQELTFVYPKRGEHRSAIIMKDWTGDGVSDAVGFVSTEGGGVEVHFLEKIPGALAHGGLLCQRRHPGGPGQLWGRERRRRPGRAHRLGQRRGHHRPHRRRVRLPLPGRGRHRRRCWAPTAKWPSRTLTATASARCSPWTSTWPPRRRAPRPCPPRPTSTPGRTAPCRSCTPPARTTPSPATRPSTSASWAGTSPPWWWTAPRPTAA